MYDLIPLIILLCHFDIHCNDILTKHRYNLELHIASTNATSLRCTLAAIRARSNVCVSRRREVLSRDEYFRLYETQHNDSWLKNLLNWAAFWALRLKKFFNWAVGSKNFLIEHSDSKNFSIEQSAQIFFQLIRVLRQRVLLISS